MIVERSLEKNGLYAVGSCGAFGRNSVINYPAGDGSFKANRLPTPCLTMFVIFMDL
jgi:hypothetical protein